MYFEQDYFVIVDVKLCDNVTCANGGTCKDTLSGFKCTCAFGYKGLKCEEGRFLTKQLGIEIQTPINIPNEVALIPPILVQVTHFAIAGIMYNADWVAYNYFQETIVLSAYVRCIMSH